MSPTAKGVPGLSAPGRSKGCRRAAAPGGKLDAVGELVGAGESVDALSRGGGSPATGTGMMPPSVPVTRSTGTDVDASEAVPDDAGATVPLESPFDVPVGAKRVGCLSIVVDVASYLGSSVGARVTEPVGSSGPT